MAVMHDTGGLLPRDAAERAATPEEQRQISSWCAQGLDEGALGIGMGIAYVPLVTRAEILEVVPAGGRSDTTPVYVHMRNGGPVEPGVIDALQEVIADAAATGASLHVVHITSMGLRETPLCLEMIEGARKRGLDVTTEAYPYTAGMTDLGSAIFDEGWQERAGRHHVQRSAMGGHRRAADGGNLRALPQAGRDGGDPFDSGGDRAAGHGGSDGDDRERRHSGERQGSSARRPAPTARVLGRYVREQHALSLMDALRKMTRCRRNGWGSNPRAAGGGRGRGLAVFDPARVTIGPLSRIRRSIPRGFLCAGERRAGGAGREAGGGSGSGARFAALI